MRLVTRYQRAVGAGLAMSLLVSCIFAPGVLAQETAWKPPVPAAQGKDWVKLTSGEWLQGEIKSMRDESLEFDSEKLDLLKLDWSDVAEIRSSRDLQYVFADGRTATGTSAMQAGVVKIGAGAQVQEFQVAQIVSIVTGAKSEWDYWSGNASLGLVARSGNTDQTDLNMLVFIRRETARARFDINYAGNFGELSGIRSVNNHLMNSKLDLFLSRRLFVTPVAIEISSDEFQNIDLRYTLSAGFGYDVLKGKIDWYLHLAGGYVRTDYRSVEPGQSDPEESGAVIPNTTISWDPTDAIETDFTYNATISVPEVENTFHHLVLLTSVDMVSIVDLTFSLAWDRTESPRTREDGTTPGRNDFRISFGLGIDY